MDGIFVSVDMNGPSTKVLINQFDGTNNGGYHKKGLPYWCSPHHKASPSL